MKRLLIDLTDIKTWTGRFAGIQRVVYGVAKEFYLGGLGSDIQVKFIAFNNEGAYFYETTFADIYEKVEKNVSVGKAEVKELPIPEVRKYTIVKNRLKEYLSASSRESLSTKNNDPEHFDFKAEDTVLILGMSWESNAMQVELERIKNEQRIRVAQIVYDLIISLYPHLHHPDNFGPYTRNMEGVLKVSDQLFPISTSTASDIVRFAKNNQKRTPRIDVIRLGDEIETLGSRKPDDRRIANKFILCVGTIEIRKNHTLLYYAYKLASERGIKLPQLVIVGGSGWYTGDLQYTLANDKEIEKSIIIMKGIDDAELSWLYKNCLYTVYPSIYEGWGLPIAESLAYGKVCAASHSSSMTEIGGDLVKYYSPYSTEELLSTMVALVSDKKRSKLEQEIVTNYKKTKWHDTAGQILEYLGK